MAERRTIVIIGAVIAIVLGALAVWTLLPSSARPVATDLTEISDPAELSRIIGLDHISIATSTNYVGHRIYVVSGKVKNLSDKRLRLIEVKMTFLDREENAVEEGVYKAFDVRQKPLEPGTEYRFELNFENLPRTWNYRVPNTEVAKAAY